MYHYRVEYLATEYLRTETDAAGDTGPQGTRVVTRALDIIAPNDRPDATALVLHHAFYFGGNANDAAYQILRCDIVSKVDMVVYNPTCRL